MKPRMNVVARKNFSMLRWPWISAWCAIVTVTLDDRRIVVLMSGKPNGSIGSKSPPTLPGPFVGHVPSKPFHSNKLVKKLLLSPPSHGTAMLRE